MKPKHKSLNIPGVYRNLQVKALLHPQPNNKAVVIANAFIENPKWYFTTPKSKSIPIQLFNTGHDVYFLNFVPVKKRLAKASESVDMSFEDIVYKLLPRFHRNLVADYQSIHYVGHSYGVTLLMAFLLGFERQNFGAFGYNEHRSKAHQENVVSFVSLAGLFKLSWPEDSLHYDPFVSQLLHLAVRYGPFDHVQKLMPLLPLSKLKYLEPFVDNWFVRGTLKGLAEINPVFNPHNAKLDQLLKAICTGSNDESLESLQTIFALYNTKEKLTSRTGKALKEFTEQLTHFDLPICFIQGEKDFMTPPEVIKEFGFEKVSSTHKEWCTLDKTGHQDLLVAQNPQMICNPLKNWISQF